MVRKKNYGKILAFRADSDLMGMLNALDWLDRRNNTILPKKRQWLSKLARESLKAILRQLIKEQGAAAKDPEREKLLFEARMLDARMEQQRDSMAKLVRERTRVLDRLKIDEMDWQDMEAKAKLLDIPLDIHKARVRKAKQYASLYVSAVDNRNYNRPHD